MTPYPEFPHVTSTKIGMAVLALLKADSALSEFFEEITVTETEDLYTLGSYDNTSLILYLSSHELRPKPGDCYELESVLTINMLTPAKDTRDNCEFLRDRIVGYIEVLLQSNSSLQYEGVTIADDLLRFERTADAQTIAEKAHILTEITSIWTSQVDLLQGVT